MPGQKLREFLNEHGVKYATIIHSPAFTAQEIAASAHVPGKELAKTVMVELDGKMAMAVMSAAQRVNLDELKAATGAADVKLACEREFADLFPGCEIGAMPPFGNLYNMEVYVTPSLAQDEYIAFNAGSHTELIRMKYEDYANLVEPKIMEFTAVH
jgi:Ala-tRNA(Pro) deacylase